MSWVLLKALQPKFKSAIFRNFKKGATHSLVHFVIYQLISSRISQYPRRNALIKGSPIKANAHPLFRDQIARNSLAVLPISILSIGALVSAWRHRTKTRQGCSE